MKTNNLLNLRSAQVLTKSELENIVGGDTYCYCHSETGDFLGTIINYDGSVCDDLCVELYGDRSFNEEYVIPGF